MLAALKFVQGAIGKKEIVTELTHFQIRNNRITSYNGRISLSCPIDIDIDCCPKADDMVKAIRACEDTVQLHMTPGKKLAIRSGKFRTHIETIEEAFVGVDPIGQHVKPSGDMLPILSKLSEVISTDASRPWANGILFDGESAFATNNVVLVEAWLGYHFPYRINVPRYAIREILRIGEEPVDIQLDESGCTFHFSESRYLRTQLLDTGWPDARRLLDNMLPTTTEVPDSLFEALQALEPFADKMNRVYIRPGVISTSIEEDVGTAIEVEGIDAEGVFSIDMLLTLRNITHTIGLEHFPRVPFYGDSVRGVIAGMRQ